MQGKYKFPSNLSLCFLAIASRMIALALLSALTAVFTGAGFALHPTTMQIGTNAATISERALLPKRSTSPAIGQTTQQVCAYITGDAFDPLACNEGQFCHFFPSYLGCCNTAIPFNSTITRTYVWTDTLSLTASNTVTDVTAYTDTETYYSYHDCGYVTTCYNSESLSYSSICTGSCLSNKKNLLW